MADRGQTDRAIDYYKKALDMDQDDVNLYYNLSALYERKGNKDVADKYLAGAVEMQSGDLESRIRLADSLIKRGKYKEAEKYLNEVLKKNPDSMDAWLLTVQMEEKRGNKKGLISAYRKIVSLDSKNGNALYNLGILEYETGDLNNAMIHLENYSKSHPNDTTTGPFLFDIYRKKKKDDLAYKEALKILKARPKEKGYYSFLFEYLDGKKDYKSMVKVMEGGVKNNPGDMDLRRYLIVALLQTGNDRGAVEQIREILNKNPSDVPLLMQLAGLQEKLGNPEEAAEIYKKVLEISPGNEKAEEAYLRMRLEALPGNR